MALALVQCEIKKHKTSCFFSHAKLCCPPKNDSHSFYFSCSVFEKSLGLRLQKVLRGSASTAILSSSVECRTDRSSAFPFNQMNPNTDFHCLKTFGSHFTEDIAIPSVRSNPSFDFL
jgi:hypothetical protein